MPSSALEHKHILLTRAQAHLPELDQLLRLRAAVPIHFPCLELEYLPAAIMDVIIDLHSYSDVLFSSANGVDAVAQCLLAEGQHLKHLLHQQRIAAVGEKTAAALHHYGIDVDIIPDVASQDGLIAAYKQQSLPRALLFFRAEEGRESLAEYMAQQAVPISTIAAYRTICPTADASPVIRMLQHHNIDAVLLGSRKAARFYIQRIGSPALADRPAIAVISGGLATVVNALGLHVQVVAKQASFEAMLDGLAEYFDCHADSP